MIYFIYAKTVNRLKIGYSRADNFDNRLAGLISSSPVDLTVIKTVPGNLAMEKAIHRKFWREKHHGEWFRFTDRLDQFVKDFQGDVLAEESNRRSDTFGMKKHLERNLKEGIAEGDIAIAKMYGCNRTTVFKTRRKMRASLNDTRITHSCFAESPSAQILAYEGAKGGENGHFV